MMQCRNGGSVAKHIKNIYYKPMASRNLNGEKVKVVSQKSKPWEGWPVFPPLFKMVLEDLARAMEEIDKRYANMKRTCQMFQLSTVSSCFYILFSTWWWFSLNFISFIEVTVSRKTSVLSVLSISIYWSQCSDPELSL